MGYTVTITRNGDVIYAHEADDQETAQRIAATQHERVKRFGDYGDYSITVRFDFIVGTRLQEATR